jgi:hypothetical protein
MRLAWREARPGHCPPARYRPSEAVATHVRVGNPPFSHILFGIYLGIALWGGLWLRDARVSALLPVG